LISKILLVCQTPTRRVKAAWVSTTGDGDVSFGLNDKTYITPRTDIIKGVWSAFNRRSVEFVASTDPACLESVKNPHFTYHQPDFVHLRADGDSEIFKGILPLPLMLSQQEEVPWIRATTAPLTELKMAGNHRSSIPTRELVILIPKEDRSIQISIDFVRKSAVGLDLSKYRYITAGPTNIRIHGGSVAPQIATLAWSHEY